MATLPIPHNFFSVTFSFFHQEMEFIFPPLELVWPYAPYSVNGTQQK